jgi:hypothetical protein
MHDDDITALHNLQSESFAPASMLCIKPENGRVVVIKVYAPLGWCTGITGIGFVYDTGIESMWGSDYDAASLSFFLGREEHLVNVRVYKINSLVCHLQVGITIYLMTYSNKIQFTTDLCRTSDFMPQAPMKSISLDYVDYRALNGGYIVGFCGCFVVCQPPKILNQPLILVAELFSTAELLRGYTNDHCGFFEINLVSRGKLRIQYIREHTPRNASRSNQKAWRVPRSATAEERAPVNSSIYQHSHDEVSSRWAGHRPSLSLRE